MSDNALLDFYTLINKINELYPEIAPLAAKPGVGQVLLQAVNEGWSPSRTKAAIQNTEYWKSTDQSQRQWDVLQATDPGEAKRQLGANRLVVLTQARNLGLQMTKQQLAYNVQYATEHGFSAKEITYHMLAQRELGDFTPGNSASPVGQVGATMTKIAARANDYGISMSDNAIFRQARQVLQGTQTTEGVDQFFKNRALSKYQAADVQRALNEGMTVKDYMDPYMQVAAKTLELNPASMNMEDGKWIKAIDNVAPDGTRQVMSLADWQRTLKTDTSYGYDHTDGARNEAAQLTNQLAQTFGASA